MAGQEIRVLVVDDSAVIRAMICDNIAKAPGMEVAGTAGDGRKAMEIFEGESVRLIVVGSQKTFPEELAEKLSQKGHIVLHYNNYEFQHPSEAWELLRRFGEGMKVSVQGVLMATETGLVDMGEEVISLGGTGTIGYEPGGGVDTAIVMEAVKGEGFFKIDLPQGRKKREGRKIKELLCKPR